MDLRGKNVVITGGSGGIGAEMARSFAGRGAHVLVVARSEAKLQSVAADVGGDYLIADLGTDAGVDELVGRCVERLGRIDVWVNNAGIETSEAFVAIELAELRQLARLNFEAPLLLTRAVLGHMRSTGDGSGHIVQMGSVSSAVTFPGFAAYGGTKAGLTHFTEAVRLELKGSAIGFTVVSPGPVATEMWDRVEGGPTPFAAPALRRFRQLWFLPVVSPHEVADQTTRAVERDRRFARMPRRFTPYHALSNAPRRMIEIALAGVQLPVTREVGTDAPGSDGHTST